MKVFLILKSSPETTSAIRRKFFLLGQLLVVHIHLLTCDMQPAREYHDEKARTLRFTFLEIVRQAVLQTEA